MAEQSERIASSPTARALSATRVVAFGPVFKRMRRARRMTRAQLALKAGLSSAYIRQLERGRQQPSSTTVVRLAEGLGVSLIVARALLRLAGQS
jgi:transcriptional regulator with XRE-family HTH domain